MSHPARYSSSVILGLITAPAYAEPVDLPVPFLAWSFYALLIFGLVVAVGIFIRRSKVDKSEQLGSLLSGNQREVHFVGPEIPVTECVNRMNELRIGAMLVLEDGKLVGIFTERDALTRVLGAGLDPVSTKVSAVMTRNPVSVGPSMPLDEARMIITNQRIRHLPVVQGGKVIGMVSSGDLTHWLVRNPASEIQDLVETTHR